MLKKNVVANPRFINGQKSFLPKTYGAKQIINIMFLSNIHGARTIDSLLYMTTLSQMHTLRLKSWIRYQQLLQLHGLFMTHVEI